MDIEEAGRSLQRLVVEVRPIGSLKLYENNPRTHSRKQVAQIAESLKRFGWTNPILVDDGARVIAGHGRLAAAKLMGMSSVPVINLGQMSEAKRRAYIIADNRIAEQAGWDEGLLKIEFEYLLEADLGFSIEAIGFEMADIDRVIGAAVDGGEEPVELPDPKKPAVTERGDRWIIGAHRIYCGDARSRKSYEALLDDEKAAMVFTDPPFNVAIDGHVSGLGSVTHREFAMASGEMNEAQFTLFLREAMEQLAGASADGSIHYICMDWRHMGEMIAASKPVYGELKNLCVWAKTNAGMGTFYRSQHELVFVFKSGKAAHINNFGLGDKGRYRTNVWTYAGANSFGATRQEDLASHPTVKPVIMIADAILDCSRRNDIVLDAFLGSGATLLAAERTGRRGRGIELEPLYVDLAVKRLQKESGKEAVLWDGTTFAERMKEKELVGA